MLPFGATGSGESDAVICMSAWGVTYDVDTATALLALLASPQSLPVVNSWLMVWLLIPNCARPALRTIVKTSLDPEASVAAVQVNDPPNPTDSEGHDHPAGTVIDCQSSVPFMTTFRCAVVAVAGPA